MINQVNDSRSNDDKSPRSGARSFVAGWREMSAYIRFTIVMVAVLLALVI